MDDQVRYVRIRDTADLQLEGQTTVKMREAVFYIGNHGPFTERITADSFDAEFPGRVAALKASLAMLPR